MIDIQNLSKIYHMPNRDIIALKNINLHVNKGEIFGIIGLSGAGKSTLIRCVNMLERPTQGDIIVDNQNISQLNQKELRLARQKIGMIFQHFNLLSSRTVLDNIMFPLEIAKVKKRQAQKRAEDLLELVGLKEKARVYPQQLSGGQKQRVGIARALANEPKLLLSDEATSALDPQTTRSILALLKDINKQLGLTILLITHDMGVIKEACDRVAVIDQSEIVEIGNVLSLLSNPQTPTSRSFINTIVNKEVPKALLHKYGNQNDSQLIRVSFIGDSSGKPIISSMIKRFPVEANILYGNIDSVKETPFGNLTLELLGPHDDIQQCILFLQENHLEVEVLAHD